MCTLRVSSWKLEYNLQQCLDFFDESFRISHIFRQKNTVADRLAAWTHEHEHRIEVFCDKDLPPMVLSMYRAEKLGIWNFRG